MHSKKGQTVFSFLGDKLTTQTKICGGGGTVPHILLPTKIASDCGIGDIRAHIFCPQMTQELAKYTIKQDRLNNCLNRCSCHKSIADTPDTEDCKDVCLC